MTTITIHSATDDCDYQAEIIETVTELADATVYIVAVADCGRFAAVVYSDGTVITSIDWQGTCGHDDPETVREEIADPAWAHHWMRAADTANCIILDGLPRVLG